MIIKEILITFVGTIMAIFSAGVLWLIKLAYEKHKAELSALVKFERIFAVNATLLRDNFEFINRWTASLRENRSFSFHFESFFINEEETYKLSNLKLINKIMGLNYMLKRTSLDLDNLYKRYWDMILKIDSIQDEQQKIKNLSDYNKTILQTLGQIQKNEKPIEDSLVEVVAYIRVVNRVRYHSLFGYLSFLFKDIFPKVSQNAIDAESHILKKQIIERSSKK